MGYQQIGNIAIFNKITKKEAEKFLKKFPKIKTICIRIGKIKGKLRKPQIKVILSRAKTKKTETIHKESGILYKLDIKKVMFAKGNINERHRIAKISRKNDIVIDMFAGIGYFSLPLTKKVNNVYSIELNPQAYRYLVQNIKLNKIKNIKAIRGDCQKIVPRLEIKADRIIMGYLPSPFPYLKISFKVAKKGTIIHYSCLILRKNPKQEIKKLVEKISRIKKVKLIKAVRVKSYSPSLDHYVLDLIKV
ncbi:MAG: DNA cytosine methyltransferase [Candidatus Pacearchaeota archaeon]|nr:MAG: DNA cytosine methyltransferase [Candidatus Pacearchaeota archaeon]